MRFVISFLMYLGWLGPALANDSEAEIAVGGLVLKETDAISLDSEDLYISKDEVRVDYRFTNSTAQDIETTVAFPLPDQVYDENGEGYFHDMKKELAFETTADGKPVAYDIVEQAIKEGSDVTQRIRALGLPLNASDNAEAFSAKVAALPQSERKSLMEDGLIENRAVEGDPFYGSLWSLRTAVTRQQMFPAGKTVAVRHRYKPLVGGSVGGNLNAEFRNEDWGKEHGQRFCIENSWYRALDAALAKRGTADVPSPYNELWIGYVLSSGANWKGPIKDFRLVVDKGKPENLVSFCAEGVAKIAPTQFEVRKKNFEPKEDLNILIVEWYKPGEGEGQ
jgi:Domain of unknown function (DUF4424)